MFMANNIGRATKSNVLHTARSLVRKTESIASNNVFILGSLSSLSETRRDALLSAVSGPVRHRPDTPIDAGACVSLPARAGRRLRKLRDGHLLIVAEGLGPLTAVAAVVARLSARLTFLVFFPEPPARVGPLDRLVLRLADGVVVDGDAAALAIADAAFPTPAICRVAPDHALERFLSIAPPPRALDTWRIVVASQLTPGSGAADLLVALIAWAEARPDTAVELTWIGTGDLMGVLAAQPLPENMAQAFSGEPGTAEVAEIFARSDLLAVPSITDDMRAPVAQALAAGLPVIGSRRSRDVRHLVTDCVNGWLFDPLTPDAMAGALDRALDATGPEWDDMRRRARDSVSATRSGNPLAHVRRPGSAGSPSLRPASQPAPTP